MPNSNVIIKKNTEITIEVNPGTVTIKKLEEYKARTDSPLNNILIGLLYIQKGEKIIATGNVKLYKDEWFASADKASTTSKFDELKLQGNAMVEKGGDNQ